MKLESPDFHRRQDIPEKFTCDGEDVHPTLLILDAPAKTVSFALIVDDIDSPKRPNWVHWLIWNIPAGTGRMEEGRTPSGVVEGTTDFGKVGYGGPCPGSGEHTYVFRLYALDTILTLPSGATRAELEAAMDGHLLAQAELAGLYKRKNA